MIKHKFKQFIYFCLLFLLLPIIVNAADLEIVGTTSSIQINNNRSMDINESFDIYYINSTNVFKRTLDKKIDIYRKNNTKTTENSIIKNINSALPTTISKTNQKETISLSLAGKKDTIEKADISYEFYLGKDNSSKYDEIFYNIISNFDAVVSDVTFEIILPEDATLDAIEFSLNGNQMLTDDDVTYYVEGNIITGYLNRMLSEQDTFSVRLQFPNGYFKQVVNTFDYKNYLFILPPIAIFILSLFYYIKYGFKNSVKRNNSYYPPEDLDSAEIAYLYKGFSEERDLISLVIFLANKGYLKIEENDDGYKLGKANSFKFIKIKDYDKRNAGQKLLFRGIFKNRKTSELSDIEYTTEDSILNIKKVLDNIDNKLKFFYLNSKKVKKIIYLLLSICLIIINIIPIREMGLSYFLVPVLSGIMLFGLGLIYIFQIKSISKYIIGAILLAGSLYISIHSIITQQHLLIIYIISMLLIIVSVTIVSKLPYRTKAGNKKYGAVLGFRSTLIDLPIHKLEELLNENPNYFYDMIPYAYVLNIFDMWLEKGKNVILNAPKWHITKEEFSISKEGMFVKNVLFTTTQIMIKGIYAKKPSNQLKFKVDEINEKLGA